jgi:Lon protease-like protein
VSDEGDDYRRIITDEALAELPIFPLPQTVLIPRTLMSLHIFEPRYRRMIEDCADGHRVLAVGLLDESRGADRHGRPAIHPVAGVGILRRSARLPDGRFNIVLEGAYRANVEDELDPGPAYRRVRARLLFDEAPQDRDHVEQAVASLRSLCSRVVAQMADASDTEIVERLNEVKNPGALADLIAAALIHEVLERQRILAEPNVERRLDLAAAALAHLLLRTNANASTTAHFGWGIGPGKA